MPAFKQNVLITTLFQNNCLSVVILTAVLYDYVLTFSKEIEYVWTKRWTWVSPIFMLVRYCALYNVIIGGLLGSSLLPGTPLTYAFVLLSLMELPDATDNGRMYSCKVINIIDQWACLVFLGAADFIMLLRVWAIYNRSRLVLIILLVFYSLEIATLVAVNVNPKNPSIFLNTEIKDLAYCTERPVLPVWMEIATICQAINGAVMCILATIQCGKDLLQMYRATKRWQLNRYMNLLVKQGIFYFVAKLLFQILNLLCLLGMIPTSGWGMMVLSIVEYVPIYTLAPRFFISMRELYACDVRRSNAIDSAFGLSSSRDGAIGSEIRFVDVGQDGEEAVGLGVGMSRH